MKNLLLILISISFSLSTNFSQAQIYNMSNTTVNTCSGTFYDPQGTGDYVSGQALIEMTFCSSVPTDEIILDFSGFGFQVETNFDFLNIYDGVGTGGAVLWDSQASGGAVNPGVITSTTGCVTVTWSTDGSVTYEGWGAAISCSTPTCTDGVQNGTETLIDCGGASCPPCTDILISDGGTINACSGYFYDAGGTGNYDFNENYVTTICSGTGDEVTMDFSNFAFGLQANNDVLYIYDGTGTGGTPIWESITGNGLVNPGAITSTTGCLTFEFISDGVTNNIGWVGELSCPSCTDGIQNGNETGVDCGGPTCVACPNCFNGIQDGNETGIDCGPSCAQPCHCSDGILNFDEEDIDCGGSCLPCPEPCSLDLSWVVDGTGSVTYPGGTAYTMSTGTINTCGGTFYDPGGSGGSYGNNDVNTMTFCTDNPDPNAQIVFDFTLWDLETCCDYLTIYDGPDNSSPQIYYGDGGDPTPGYVQSTNGCLTFFWDSDGSVVDIGWAANIGCYIPPVFDCNGGDILLTANGQGEYYEAMNNNFDFGQAGSGWSSNITADFTNPCDPSIDGGTYMWMGNSAPHPREIETAPLDLSCGGEICFFLDFATQGNASPCEGIDLPGEGVFLEFSTDGGTTWNTIEYFGPAGVGNNVDNGGTDPQMTAWNQYCYDIPAAAMTPNTIIHWAQTGSSGINNDHWGLDNVTISSLVSCDPYVYDYWQVPGPDNNPVQTETLTTTTTYTVTYSNGVDACTTSVTVPVPPGTTADAGPDYTICPGAAPVTLGADPVTPDDGADYAWDNGAGTGIVDITGGVNGQVDVSPATTTEYILSVTFNGCTTTDTALVTVNPPPPVDAGPDVSVCLGSSTDLTASGADTYVWSPATGLSATTGTTVTATPLVTTVYTVTGTDVDGCVGTDIVTVTIDPQDDPTFTLTDFCLGDANAATITGTGGGTFTYNPDPLDGSSVNGTTGSITSPIGGTTYDIEYTTGGVCPATLIQSVTVNALPIVASPDVTVCLGGSVDLTATGATTYDWSPATELNQTTGATVTSTPTANITYTVTGTDANGCVNTDLVNVTVSGNAAIDAGPDVTICLGGNTTLTGTGGVTYDWDDGFGAPGVGNNFIVSPATTTTYTVTGTDVNGCSGTDQMTVTIGPDPTVDPITDQTLCANTNTTDIIFTGSIGGTTYDWTNDNGTIGIGTSGTGDILSFVGLNATITSQTGTITVTPTANGCVGLPEMFTITIDPIPTVDPVLDQELCEGDATTDVIFTGDNASSVYDWTNDNTNTGLGAAGNGDILAFTGSNSGSSPEVSVITVTPTANGCAGLSESFTITTNPLPTATISGTLTVCDGDTDPVITFTGANGMAPYTFTYNINGGVDLFVTSTGNTATVTVPSTPTGTYNYNLLSVVDASSTACSQVQTGTATITVNPNPTPIINGATTYCTGTFSTLSTSQVYPAYTWSTGDLTATTDVTEADNPITVTVTNGFGCTGTSAVFVVAESNVVTYNSTVEICAGASTLIHGNLESVAGVYTQTFTLPSGCDSVSNVTLDLLPLPVVTSPDVSTCINEPVTMTASGAVSYVWSPGTELNSTVGPTVISTPSATITYTITGTDVFGCVGTGQVTVTAVPLPTATVSGATTVCLGDAEPTLTFTGANGTAPYTFTYSINGGPDLFVTSAGNVATVSAPTGTAGSFTYTLSNVSDAGINGCSQVQTGSEIIVVNPLPTATVSGTIDVCQGAASPVITFTGADGVAPYTFTYNIDGGAAQTVTSAGNTATVLAPTNVVGTFDYNLLSVTDNSLTGCSQAQIETATVTVNPIPTATIAGDAEVCVGAAGPVITFTGAGGTAPYTFTYNIDGGANLVVVSSGGNSATVIASTAQSGTTVYNLVSVMDGSSTTCSQAQTGSVTVIVNELPTATISGTAVVCLNGADQTITFTGAGGVAPYTFSYTFNNGPVQTIVSTGNTATMTVPAAAVGVFNYSLQGVQDSSPTGCSQSQSGIASITVSEIPDIYAGNDITICDGDGIILNGSGGITYVWDNGVINGQEFFPTVTDTFTVIGTDASGCVNVDEVIIIVDPIPVVTFTADTTMGCAPLTVTFTNTTVGEFDDCIWYLSDGTILNGCGSVTNTFEVGGTFDVTLDLTNVNGCQSSTTYQYYIYVEDAPDASFTPSSSILSTLDTEVDFYNTSTGFDNSYLWSFGDGGAISTDINPSYTYPDEESGSYLVTLIATSPLGCVDTAFVTIVVQEEVIFYVPNTFTPDEDDFNPTFQPVFTSGYDPFDFTLLIFNRWGEVIFESHNAEVGWDGTYGVDGDLVQDGSYTWKIEFKTTATDERVMVVGHVNMIR